MIWSGTRLSLRLVQGQCSGGGETLGTRLIVLYTQTLNKLSVVAREFMETFI